MPKLITYFVARDEEEIKKTALREAEIYTEDNRFGAFGKSGGSVDSSFTEKELHFDVTEIINGGQILLPVVFSLEETFNIRITGKETTVQGKCLLEEFYRTGSKFIAVYKVYNHHN